MKKKRKFKIGDKVRIRQWNDMKKEFGADNSGAIDCNASFVEEMKEFCGKTAKITKIKEDGHVDLLFDDLSSCGYWDFTTDMFELIDKEQAIVIYRKGQEVIALNKQTKEKAVAKCSSDDEFDFKVGAKLAFDRLMSEKEKPTYYNGKVVCIEVNIFNTCNYTVGKIYQFKDGQLIGNAGLLFDGKRFKNFKEFAEYTNNKFLEIVE